ncbi:MAG: NAD(P)-dependent oxidoreductase [Victivallales bacterium]|nr:NAD(P)-dependent oxidoreductase [Victivallales bacterium]
MKDEIKIGVLKETKTPPDKRVAITPLQAHEINNKYSNVQVYVQSSDIRCYSDAEYEVLGVKVTDSVEFCDILIGVKEVKEELLVPNKTYFFFSHTAKKQLYNKILLKEILNRNITLVDYEYLVDDNGNRIIAFSKWAGIIGCYNAFIAYGKKTNSYSLKPASQMSGINGLFRELDKVKLPPLKIVITGHGKAGMGAAEILDYMNIPKVSSQNFLTEQYDHPVYTILDPTKYVIRNDRKPFTLKDFFRHPKTFSSNFKKYSDVSDILIACHFWDPNSPVLFTPDDMLNKDFKISVIADVTCDINGSIPSTVRPATIREPLYGYNPFLKKEVDVSDPSAVTVMAVDNLPGELPRDTSNDFGSILLKQIIPLLISGRKNRVISDATIASNGFLTEKFSYLKDFVNN